MDKKKLRKELFIQLDGIALTAPIACLFNSSDESLEKIIQGKKIDALELKESSINLDYLNVSLRLFESQGLLKRIKVDNKSIMIQLTSYGIKFFEDYKVYLKFFKYFETLTNLSINKKNLHKTINSFLHEFNQIETNNEIIKIHIKGLLVGPLLVSLFMNDFAKISNQNRIIFSDKINLDNKKAISNFFEKINFIINNDELTEKGLFFCKRSSAYGVTVSYMPLFLKIKNLIQGDSSRLLLRDKNGNETHVNRKMNVWGSGGAHKLYFKKIDEIIIKIFNGPIKNQPKGIADMGCGDGTLLIHLYDLIKNKTKRGKVLEQNPLHVIGADFNNEALDVTSHNLRKRKIKHFLIKADIGNPKDFNKKLLSNHKINLNDLLSVRSFLDHNRIFEMPTESKYNINEIKTNSTAAFCSHLGNKILKPNVFKLSLIEHFLRWKPFINKYGLILVELHTIHPENCYKNIGSTLATPYDATHGFSNQYIIEYEEFIDSAKIAGLKNNKKFEFTFPNKNLTTVSINLLSV